MAASHAAYESESLVEALDYYPYGGQRTDSKTNYGGVRNKYAGTVYDALSGLNYMQARYETPGRGQFTSEDPSMLALGDTSRVKQVTGQDQTSLLMNPQQMNYYSYANDNPVTLSDPTGKIVPLIVAIGVAFEAYAAAQGAVDYYDYHNMNVKYANVTTVDQKRDSQLKLGADVVSELTGQGLERAGYQVAGLGFSFFSAAGDATEGSLYQFFRTSDLNFNNINISGSKAMTTPTIASIGQLYSNSVAARQAAVSTINASSAGNSNANKLFVTPNGAVVTWSGQVVSSKPSGK
jgi:RHS repeat-associated protein